MKFCTENEHVPRSFFGYRDIAEFSPGPNGSHFKKWPLENKDFNISRLVDYIATKFNCYPHVFGVKQKVGTDVTTVQRNRQ